MSTPPPVTRTVYNPDQRLAVTFLKTSAETNGKYTLLECRLEPGGGVSRHVHRTYEKTFEVTSGALGIETAGGIKKLYKGDRFVAVRYVQHRFFNASDRDCTFLAWIMPGKPGLEIATQILFGLVADGQTHDGAPRDQRILGLLLQLSNIQPSGWAGWFEGWWRWQAKRAVKAGLDRALYERYVEPPQPPHEGGEKRFAQATLEAWPKTGYVLIFSGDLSEALHPPHGGGGGGLLISDLFSGRSTTKCRRTFFYAPPSISPSPFLTLPAAALRSPANSR